MIISWNWLKEYVRLDMPVETLTERLMLAGFNLEGVSDVEGDLAIDIEVTSNRADCLCHLGVAREVAALFDRPVTLPAAQIHEAGPAAHDAVSVEIECPDLCPRYLARLVRGVKVAESPAWMRRRLSTLGIRPVNNVVDITNYVLMECGQPLHAFDFDRLNSGRIIVRRARPQERITAIDQREYVLNPEMCVIADAERAAAVAGVMGGVDSEISPATTNVLIEAAEFAPLAVRNTARALNLHSDSSYRFERGIDRGGIDWASRRCAQLMVELAGGQLCRGVVQAGAAPCDSASPIKLRLAQIPRILGIDVERAAVERILRALRLEPVESREAGLLCFVPPSWRRDLTREIDLIEEVARIHGYEHIPEDVPLPLTASATTPRDRLHEQLVQILTGAGFFEAVCLSFVSSELCELFHPWSSSPPLRVEHSSRQRENILRQSLVPSLLAARRSNERKGVFDARLFEIAHIYLDAEPGNPLAEPRVLGLVGGQSFSEMKGVIERLVDQARRGARVAARPAELGAFLPGRGCELFLEGQRLGWLGELSDAARHSLDLQDPVTVAEIDLARLEAIAEAARLYRAFAEFPSIERDLNLVLDEDVSWQELEETAREAAGELLESVSFAGQYRGPQIPANKKSYVARLCYRSRERTLTAAEVDQSTARVVAACGARLRAVQR
jgi:phenylalanyl-tRNA synthetase beta chain